MLRNNTLFLYYLFLTTGSATAFSIAPTTATTPLTQLSVSTTTHFVLDTECLLEAEYCVPSEQRHTTKTRLTVQQQQQATWMDLPRHTTNSNELIDLELQMGRIAMVFAILLCVTELTTGQSLALLGH